MFAIHLAIFFLGISKWHSLTYLKMRWFFPSLYGLVNIVMVMSSWWVSLLTLSLDRLSPLRSYPVLVHILSPITDNYPSWIRVRERVTIDMISWSISTKVMWPRWDLNLQPWICSQTCCQLPLEPTTICTGGLCCQTGYDDFMTTPIISMFLLVKIIALYLI